MDISLTIVKDGDMRFGWRQVPLRMSCPDIAPKPLEKSA